MPISGKKKRYDISLGLTPEQLDEIRETLEEWVVMAGVEESVQFSASTIIEEMATNIMEHSGASWLEVGVYWFDDGVLLVVADDGKKFDPAAANKSIHEQLAAFDIRHLGLAMIGQITKNFVHFRDEETKCNRAVIQISNATTTP